MVVEGILRTVGGGNASWCIYASFIYETTADTTFLDIRNDLSYIIEGKDFLWLPHFCFLGGLMRNKVFLNNFTMNGSAIQHESLNDFEPLNSAMFVSLFKPAVLTDITILGYLV